MKARARKAYTVCLGSTCQQLFWRFLLQLRTREVMMKLTRRKNDQNKTHVNMEEKCQGNSKGKCIICGQEGQAQTACPKQWCVPTTVFSSWRNNFGVPREPRQRCNGRGWLEWNRFSVNNLCNQERQDPAMARGCIFVKYRWCPSRDRCHHQERLPMHLPNFRIMHAFSTETPVGDLIRRRGPIEIRC